MDEINELKFTFHGPFVKHSRLPGLFYENSSVRCLVVSFSKTHSVFYYDYLPESDSFRYSFRESELIENFPSTRLMDPDSKINWSLKL
jgi:hypothetical protein